VTVSGGLVRITGTAIDSAQADRARSVAASVASNARVEADIAIG
jgi:osmotically-inducible protein OsmY